MSPGQSQYHKLTLQLSTFLVNTPTLDDVVILTASYSLEGIYLN